MPLSTSYSGATPPSRSGLRSEPRPLGSGLSIRHRNSEYEHLALDASGKFCTNAIHATCPTSGSSIQTLRPG